jgi:hypothetical protein
MSAVTGEAAASRPTRRDPSPLWDAAVYAGCALHAALLGGQTALSVHRRWAHSALVGYAVAAVGAVVLRGARRRVAPRLRALRLGLAAVAATGALVVPLGVNVARRVHFGPAGTVMSEALVVEDGARTAARGRDPYDTTFDDPALARRHPSIRRHFPYLPGMLVFGLPRALFGPHPLTDARVAFAVFSAVVAGVALAVSPVQGRLLPGGAVVLFVLSPAALALSTGGDDVPVLALLLLATALASSGRPLGAGLAAGAAMAMKQLAWPVAALVGIHLARRRRRDAVRMAAGAAAVLTPLLVPFVRWSPSAFFEDAVRFPLGLTKVASVAASPTLGRLAAVATGRPGLVVTVAAAAVALLFVGAARLARSSLPLAVLGAAAVLAAAVLLAPSTRYGLLVWSVQLAAFSVLLALPA